MALSIDPSFALAYEARGVLAVHTGQLESAVVDFQEALALEPMLSTASASCAAAQYAQGDIEAALRSLNNALRMDRRSAQLYANRGRIYLDLDEPARAERDFRQALNLAPSDTQLAALLATARAANQQRNTSAGAGR